MSKLAALRSPQWTFATSPGDGPLIARAISGYVNRIVDEREDAREAERELAKERKHEAVVVKAQKAYDERCLLERKNKAAGGDLEEDLDAPSPQDLLKGRRQAYPPGAAVVVQMSSPNPFDSPNPFADTTPRRSSIMSPTTA